MLHPSLRTVLITVPVQVGSNPDQSRREVILLAPQALRSAANHVFSTGGERSAIAMADKNVRSVLLRSARFVAAVASKGRLRLWTMLTL